MTRAAGQAEELSSLLRDLGADVVEAPLIRLEAVVDPRAKEALARLDAYDYLLFTSANAVRYLASTAADVGADLSVGSGGGPQVYAVGPATAREAQSIGLTCRHLPQEFVASSLGDVLVDAGVRGKRILFPRSEIARDDLPRRLTREGATVDLLVVYRTVRDPDAAQQLPGLLRSGLDMVTFTSGSTVEAYAGIVGADHAPVRGLRFACIGPVTGEVARRAKLGPDVVAEEHTAAGLAAAIADYYAGVQIP